MKRTFYQGEFLAYILKDYQNEAPTLISYLKKCNIPLKGKGKKSLIITQ